MAQVPKHLSVIGRMDELIFETDSIRSEIDKKVAEGLTQLDKKKFFTEVFDLTLFGKVPSQIQFCRLSFLKAGTKGPKERHINSIQRIASFQGSGAVHTQLDQKWVKEDVPDGSTADYPDRWHIVQAHTWHQLEAGAENWVVIDFQSVPESMLKEESK